MTAVTPTGVVLFGGILDGREINTSEELRVTNEHPRVAPVGKYVFTERRSRDGRLVYRFEYHERKSDG